MINYLKYEKLPIEYCYLNHLFISDTCSTSFDYYDQTEIDMFNVIDRLTLACLRIVKENLILSFHFLLSFLTTLDSTKVRETS